MITFLFSNEQVHIASTSKDSELSAELEDLPSSLTGILRLIN